VFTELARVLEPGGHLLLAFQEGAGHPVHRPDAYGTGLALTSYRHGIPDVERRLELAGFAVHATTRRTPELAHESTLQAFLFARLEEAPRRAPSRAAAGRGEDRVSPRGAHLHR
jgi:hypothetical protein